LFKSWFLVNRELDAFGLLVYFFLLQSLPSKDLSNSQHRKSHKVFIDHVVLDELALVIIVDFVIFEEPSL